MAQALGRCWRRHRGVRARVGSPKRYLACAPLLSPAAGRLPASAGAGCWRNLARPSNSQAMPAAAATSRSSPASSPGAAEAAGCRCSRATCLTPSAVSSPASARLSCPRRMQCPSQRSAMAPATQGRDAGARHRAGGGSGQASGSRVETGGGTDRCGLQRRRSLSPRLSHSPRHWRRSSTARGPAASAPGRSPGASRSPPGGRRTRRSPREPGCPARELSRPH